MNSHSLWFSANETLNIYDCGSTTRYISTKSNGLFESVSDVPSEGAIPVVGGFIAGADEEAFYVQGGTVSLNGGNVVCNRTPVYLYNVSGSVFNINGGKISYNTSEIYICSSATMNINGGEISHNFERAIYKEGGTLNLNGGTIAYNETSGSGGAIYNYRGTFNISGGTITNNVAGVHGGGIYTERDINISGSPVIANNKGADNATDNLYIDDDNRFIKLQNGSPLTTGANIGISMGNPGIFTNEYGEVSKDYFFSDDSGYVIKANDSGKLFLDEPHVHNFAYTVSGATITATCSVSECPLPDSKATLTINAPASLVYDGNEKVATLSSYEVDVFAPEAIKYYKGDELVTSCVEPGTYVAKVTSNSKTAEVEFTIYKTDVDIVIDLIDDIGTVEYTPECKGKIDAARAAYDALTESEKDLVTNYDELVAAEAAYKALDDNAKVNRVKELIDAIGTVELTDVCKGKIDVAEAAYDALPTELKELVTNKKVLFDAIELYNTLAHQPEVNDKGVAIEGKDGDLIPVNVTVKVEVKTTVQAKEGTAEYQKIQEMVGSDRKISGVYDVKLVRTVGGVETEIQPADIKEGMIIIVEITLPDGLNVQGLKVLHIHSESDITFVENFTITGNKLSFETNRLSEFTFVTPAAAPTPTPTPTPTPSQSGGFPGWAIALIVVGGLLLVCCCFFLVMFLVFPRYIVDHTNKKVVRAIKVKEHDGMVLLLDTRFRKVRCHENDVYKTREEAEATLK